MAKSVEKTKIKKFIYKIIYQHVKNGLVRTECALLNLEAEIDSDAYFPMICKFISDNKGVSNVCVSDYQFVKTIMV